jgi:hypothetical protein
MPDQTVLAGITKCRLCPREFHGPKSQVIGGPAMIGLMTQLVDHMSTAHPEQEKAIAVLTLQYRGYLRLLNYRTDDEQLRGEIDKLRWAIHTQTAPGRISDENIKALCGALAVELNDQYYGALQMFADYAKVEIPDFMEGIRKGTREMLEARLIEVLTKLRNDIAEPDKYKANMIGEKPQEDGKI